MDYLYWYFGLGVFFLPAFWIWILNNVNYDTVPDGENVTLIRIKVVVSLYALWPFMAIARATG